MRVTSWNLLHGQTIPPEPGGVSAEANRQNLELAAKLLSGSDFVGLQEVDELQPRSGEHSQVESIAAAVGTTHWAYLRTVIGTPGEQWRKLREDETRLHSQVTPLSDRSPSYGIGLISRIPVLRYHTISLGKAPVGLPLAFPGEKGVRLVYVKDEPRFAIAAELENGWTVAVTHLSFVPGVNIFQLRKVQRWLSRLPGRHLLMGDLNLPFSIPTKVSGWKSLVNEKSYPSWGAKVQFDYILSDSIAEDDIANPSAGFSMTEPRISDHLAISVELPTS